jgi:nitrate/nitrite-specific signal transduction histidine kinase
LAGLCIWRWRCPRRRSSRRACDRLHLRLAGILAIALGVAAAVWVGGYRLVVRPVERLITGLRHVEAGDYVQALNRTSNAPARTR